MFGGQATVGKLMISRRDGPVGESGLSSCFQRDEGVKPRKNRQLADVVIPLVAKRSSFARYATSRIEIYFLAQTSRGSDHAMCEYF